MVSESSQSQYFGSIILKCAEIHLLLPQLLRKEQIQDTAHPSLKLDLNITRAELARTKHPAKIRL